MKTHLSKLLLGFGVAAALGACATLSEQPPRYASLNQIHAGLTQDEVRGIAGAPAYVGSNKRTNETLWTYNYTDEFGYRSAFGVDFDKATGLVKDTSTERIGDD